MVSGQTSAASADHSGRWLPGISNGPKPGDRWSALCARGVAFLFHHAQEIWNPNVRVTTPEKNGNRRRRATRRKLAMGSREDHLVIWGSGWRAWHVWFAGLLFRADAKMATL